MIEREIDINHVLQRIDYQADAVMMALKTAISGREVELANAFEREYNALVVLRANIVKDQTGPFPFYWDGPPAMHRIFLNQDLTIVLDSRPYELYR